MNTITYNPMAGTSIKDAIHNALQTAKSKKCKVRFNFNDTILEAAPKRSADSMFQEWELITGRQAEARRGSKSGQRAIQERKDRSSRAVAASNELLQGLSKILSSGDVDGLMIWLARFSEAADHVDVKFDHLKLAGELERSGYSENEHVGRPAEFFNDRGNMAHYIVGQAINCLRMGMPPHPVTASFVQKYFAIPE